MEPGCKICISPRLFSGPIRHAAQSSRKGRKPGGSNFVSSRISTEEPLVGSALVMLVMPSSAPVGGRRAQFLTDGRTKPVVPNVKVPFDQPLPPRRRRILAGGSVGPDGGAVNSIVTLTFLFRLKPSWERYTSLRLCSIFTDFMDPELQDRRTVFSPFPTCDSPVYEFSLEMDALAFCECRNTSAAGSDRSMHFVFRIDAPEKYEAATEGGLSLSVDGEETRNVRDGNEIRMVESW
ncbi:hypothetical protein BDP81DRAFT_437548 [Colletotrichum phormii]|uniref:Uncharacterized protein n=1 Tax=Colletotrichum phormii TaxID=359342 RepID=A0AAI9ZH06_9PEZI|nr:uncharacterized protein BDP81DRAFT_437548 [Colletotrichum phormii]KAK1624395.1 hypothetical protein BDP81DRAFT_437548 [Colletotrichum phormii]